MSIAIAGANGEVGTELCFLLREAGETVIPVVRSRVAASTFEAYDFDYRVADVTNREEAVESLSGVDTIIIAAFAPYYSRGTLRPEEARRDNNRLVDHAITASTDGASVVYFSSVTAFGSEIGQSSWNWYAREKRRLERRCHQTGNQNVWIFRLGHVLGPHQSLTREILTVLQQVGGIRVQTVPERHANVVHTVTIMDAIRAVQDDEFGPGRYTLVNTPRWSWEKVFNLYAENGVEFVQPPKSDRRPFMLRVVDSLPIEPSTLLTLSPYLPDRLNRYVHSTFLDRYVADDIEEIRERQTFHRGEFDYEKAPGPVVPNLPRTEDRLELAEAAIPAVESRTAVQPVRGESDTPL